MRLFDVYSLFDVTPVRAKGTRVWDDQGTEYLDLYGGHAVISVGHCHPKYVSAVTDQLGKIGFYSNSVRNPLQEGLARKLGEACGLGLAPGFTCSPVSAETILCSFFCAITNSFSVKWL